MNICSCAPATGCVCMKACSAPRQPSSAMQKITFRSGCAWSIDCVTGRQSAASTPSCLATTCTPGATFLHRVDRAVDAIAPGLLDLVSQQRDLRLAAEVLVDPLARVCRRRASAPWRLLKITQPSVPGQRLVGVVEELHVRRVRLLDQRRHRVVVEREHDHAADALADPRVELVDLRVELAVRVALEQLVAAALGGLAFAPLSSSG